MRVNYYANLFDVSGYGEAGRSYIRALQNAGVRVSAIDTGPRSDRSRYPWIATLQQHDPQADFNLFHNIPSLWPGQNYPHGQDMTRRIPAIGITVWETDILPTRWIPILAKAVDIWVPSLYNCNVFDMATPHPTFCWPHPVTPFGMPHQGPVAALEGVHEGDFVFYSIFDWQDRKNPVGLIQAFLRAFPNSPDVVLFIKTKSGGNQQSVYHEVRHAQRMYPRATTRIIVKYGVWESDQIQALHTRGDCYVSLHCSEGWGYPLFDAVCLGKLIVATGFGGALDYLDSTAHWVVNWTEAKVLQRYVDYSDVMRWAQPDLDHAVEGLRWAYDNRGKGLDEAIAKTIRDRFSLQQIGRAALRRMQWLQTLNPVSRETFLC